MTRPRVLWIGDACVPTGFSRVTHNVLATLTDRWDISVLGINYRGDPHPFPYPIYPAYIGGDLWGWGRIEALSQTIQPDVIIINNDAWNIAKGMEALLSAQVPVIAYMPVDGLNLKPEWVHPLNHLNLAVAYTQFGIEEFRKGGLTRPAEVIPHGIDLSTYHPMPQAEARAHLRLEQHIPADAYIVGNVNRNQSRKRLDLTIACFATWVQRYHRDNAYLHLHCSSGDVGWDLVQLADYYGIGDRLILTDIAAFNWDGIHEHEMRAIYNAFDVQLSTTLGEGWGLTTLEGMACGVPQILPDYAALGEWAKDAALFVPVTSHVVATGGINTIGGVPDFDAIVEALEQMYQEKELRIEYGRRALDLSRSPQYRWEQIADQWDEAVQKVLACSPPT